MSGARVLCASPACGHDEGWHRPAALGALACRARGCSCRTWTDPLPSPARSALAGTLTYNGDLSGEALGWLAGPNLLGEVLVAVSADYDAAAHRTRVGFDYATPADRLRAGAVAAAVPPSLGGRP